MRVCKKLILAAKGKRSRVAEKVSGIGARSDSIYIIFPEFHCDVSLFSQICFSPFPQCHVLHVVYLKSHREIIARDNGE